MRGALRKYGFNLLSEDDVESIHEHSLTLLERTGVRFDSDDAVRRLVSNGAVLRPDSKNIVTFPRSVVEEAVAKVPGRHVCHARDPRNDIEYDGEHVFVGSCGGNPDILDPGTGRPRPATLDDVVRMTRLMDALGNLHSVSCIVMATDVPSRLMVVKTTEAMIRNTSKCVSGYALDRETVDVLADMWACVAGGPEELRARPLFAIYASPSSPLTYDAHVCDVALRSVEHGIPVDLVPCPMCGGTAPEPIAGGLVQQNAELLAGLMLVQTADDSLPMMYSGRLSMMDPRSGRNLWGVPEMAVASCATVQLARRYRMVADVHGTSTDASAWDMQVGIERTMTAMMTALSGADSLSGFGGAWETSASYEMLMIDNEIFDNVFRAMEGVAVDEDRLSLDVIHRVGPMGDFLGQPHTLKYVKEGELGFSKLLDKRSAGRIGREGFKPLLTRAREAAEEMLDEHVPAPLDEDVDRELTAVVEGAAKTLL